MKPWLKVMRSAFWRHILGTCNLFRSVWKGHKSANMPRFAFRVDLSLVAWVSCLSDKRYSIFTVYCHLSRNFCSKQVSDDKINMLINMLIFKQTFADSISLVTCLVPEKDVCSGLADT